MNHEHARLLPEEVREKPKRERDIVKDYMEQLDLSSEDLTKTILDIGSGGGTSFSKNAKERGLGTRIYSIDPNPAREGNIKFAQGRVEWLPFRDSEFDLVVSNAAFPFFVIRDKEVDRELQKGNLVPAERKMKETINEMFRVLRDGGQVKLGRVSRMHANPSQRAFEPALDRVLADITQDNIAVVEETPKGLLLDHKDPKRVLARLSLIILHKLPRS